MLRWLVVGVGDITRRRVIPGILAERRSQLCGIVTRGMDKAGTYGVPAYGSLDTALRDGVFDAVYVASPVFLHAPQTILALRAGKHVLCEKPMARNPAEAEEMVETGRLSGRKLGVAYYRRSYPKVARACELLRQGAIGQPAFAFACSHDWVAKDKDQEKRQWLFDPLLAGGGPLFDIGCHRIDLLNYLLGEPLDAYALRSNAVHQTAVEDSATISIRYPRGTHAVVDVRWNSKVPRDELRIVGTQGELNLTPLNGPALSFPAGIEEWPAHSNLHFPCIENFVDAVLDDKPLLSSGETARWTNWAIARAIGDGATTGMPLSVQQPG